MRRQRGARHITAFGGVLEIFVQFLQGDPSGLLLTNALPILSFFLSPDELALGFGAALLAMKGGGFEHAAGRLQQPESHRFLAAGTHHAGNRTVDFRHVSPNSARLNYGRFQRRVED